VYAHAGLSTYRHRYIGKYVRMYCRSIWRPTWRSFAAHTSPPPSAATHPSPANMHRLQLTHSFIHLAAARFHGLSARKPAQTKATDPIQPSTIDRPNRPNPPNRPNHPNRPTGSRSRCMPLGLSVFQPFSHSPCSSSAPDLGSEYIGTGSHGDSFSIAHRITPACAYALVCAPTWVRT